LPFTNTVVIAGPFRTQCHFIQWPGALVIADTSRVNLHVFDMDGTLLAGTTASLQIARHLGCSAELTALEERFAAGEIDTRGFAAAIHDLWRSLTRQAVADVVRASPWLNGIEEVCADIRRRGERSVVITMSPDFFARHLLEFGFDEVAASRFPALPFREPLDPAGILTPVDKVRIVAEMCGRDSLTPSRCVAYGDSMSDAPLFRQLTNTVAVNADHHLADLAALSYRGNDLAGAYALGRELLARHQA
jgi:phosphoserine phosphatase